MKEQNHLLNNLEDSVREGFGDLSSSLQRAVRSAWRSSGRKFATHDKYISAIQSQQKIKRLKDRCIILVGVHNLNGLCDMEWKIRYERTLVRRNIEPDFLYL